MDSEIKNATGYTHLKFNRYSQIVITAFEVPTFSKHLYFGTHLSFDNLMTENTLIIYISLVK